MDDRSALSSFGGRYYALRGLLLVPIGLLLVAAGLTDMPPIGDEGVGDGAPFFVVALVLALAGYAAFHRHYVTTFGRISPAWSTQVRVVATGVVTAVAVTAGISVDSQVPQLPVSTFGLAFAAAWLLQYQVMVGLRPHHWVSLGGLGGLSLVPMWGDLDDKVSLVMIPIGIATVAVGWFDHRELLRSLEEVRSSFQPVDSRA
jgi:hypothetical protein